MLGCHFARSTLFPPDVSCPSALLPYLCHCHFSGNTAALCIPQPLVVSCGAGILRGVGGGAVGVVSRTGGGGGGSRGVSGSHLLSSPCALEGRGGITVSGAGGPPPLAPLGPGEPSSLALRPRRPGGGCSEAGPQHHRWHVVSVTHGAGPDGRGLNLLPFVFPRLRAWGQV